MEASRASRRRRVMRRAQLRGGLILGAAVLLGIVLLAQGDDFVDVSTAEVSADQDPTTTAPTTTGAPGDTTTSTSTTSTTTTTTPGGSRPPEEVQVTVLNGTTRAGVAASNTETLAAAGYETGEAGNTAPRPDTVVYYAEGFEADAQAVQEALGAPATAEAFPEEIIDGDGQNVASSDADIVVVLGQDLPQG